VVVEHRSPYNLGTRDPVPAHDPSGQEHAVHAATQARDGPDTLQVQGRPPQAARSYDGALQEAAGQSPSGLLARLGAGAVFVTMYQVVRGHEEAFPSFASGGLLRFTDLTKADPYFILPVLSASILLAAGEVSARNVAPQQRRLMRLLPVAFTAFIARFPAGLFVYWVTSNAVTLTQNLFIYRHSSEDTQWLPTRYTVGSSSSSASDLEGSPSPRAKAGGARRKRRKR
jgi:YidC/Oxa1 family membrane protein insertase